MMTDRFSLLLRRHLLETADQQPAHGQLETALRSTAVTPQHRSWLVRLRWLVDPAAPFANTRIRHGALALALLLAASMVAIFASGGDPDGGVVFEGRWTSTDTADRSTQTLIVDGGDSPTVHFEDDFSIDCQRRGDTSTVEVAEGPGGITLDRLTVRFPSGGCFIRVGPYEAFYDYSAATDTLIDDQGATWVRESPTAT